MARLTYMYNTRVLKKTKSPIGYRPLMTHLALFWKPLEHSTLTASAYLSAADHSPVHGRDNGEQHEKSGHREYL